MIYIAHLYRSNIADFVSGGISSILARLYGLAHSFPLLAPTYIVHLWSKSNAEEELKLRHNNLCRNSFLLYPGDHPHVFDSPHARPTLVLYGKTEILTESSISRIPGTQ